MKKLVIGANILLVSFFAYRLFALYGELKSEQNRAGSFIEQRLNEIKRPAAGQTVSCNDIFGFNISEKSASKNSRLSDGTKKNELVPAGMILKVRGIFIWDSGRYAVVSLTRGRKGRKEEIKKIAVGDEVNGFKVASILRGTVILKSLSAEIIRLRIFKHT